MDFSVLSLNALTVEMRRVRRTTHLDCQRRQSLEAPTRPSSH